MCSSYDDMTAPDNADLPVCGCWNPARPMPTKDGDHQHDCPLGQKRRAEVDRLLADAMRKYQR